LNSENLNPENQSPKPSYDEFKKIRPAWTTSIRRGLEYILFRFGLYLGKKLSISQLQRLGLGIGNFAYHVLRKDRGIIIKQLKLVFPELDDTKRQQWTRECFRHFGQMLFEFLCLPQIINDQENLIRVENEAALMSAVNAKKGVILLGMHMGNWELITAYAKRKGLFMTAATATVPDQRINQLIINQRKLENIEILSRGTGMSSIQMFRRLKKKNILILIIDQDTNVNSTWVPFFGIPAKTPVGAAVFALKTGASVVSYNVIRENDGTFRLKFETLGIFDRNHPSMEQDVYSVTRKINKHLEQCIRANPQQWAWFHRRWRHHPSAKELKKMEELEQNEMQARPN
jgi:KDO2-lipid IV(A) lauroyltransferase